MRLKTMLAGFALMASPGIAAAETPMDARDPTVFAQQLSEMGYAPDKPEIGTDTTTIVAHLPNEAMVMVLGGCTQGVKCTYVALIGAFSDIKNAPANWVAKENLNFDLIKIWTDDDGRLCYGAGSVVTGMPRATFRAWVDLVTQSTDALGAEAIKAGLGPKK